MFISSLQVFRQELYVHSLPSKFKNSSPLYSYLHYFTIQHPNSFWIFICKSLNNSYPLQQYVLNLCKHKGKGKANPKTGHDDPEGEWSYSSILSLTAALDWCVINARAQTALPRERYTANILWAPGPIWVVKVNLSAPGFESRSA